MCKVFWVMMRAECVFQGCLVVKLEFKVAVTAGLQHIHSMYKTKEQHSAHS